MKNIPNIDEVLVAVKTISENKAAQIMWDYYKQNKATLAHNISCYWEQILQELMTGAPPEAVFNRFLVTVNAIPAQPMAVTKHK